MPLFDTPKIAPCPDCGKPVSMQAASCVKCGRVIQPGEMSASAAKSNRVSVWVAIIAAGLIVLWTLWVVFVEQRH